MIGGRPVCETLAAVPGRMMSARLTLGPGGRRNRFRRVRRCYALVALGRDAPVVRRDQALRVLDSLRFDSVPRGRDAPEAR